MAEVQEKKEKEYVEGTWEGKPVRFNRTYSGHRFTDEEVERLWAGERVEIDVTTSKMGEQRVSGKLGYQSFTNNKGQTVSYFGFGDKKYLTPPHTWCGHTFDDDEYGKLMAGEVIELRDLVSKRTGNVFSAPVKYVSGEGIRIVRDGDGK